MSLLLIAAILRFYDLSGNPLGIIEAEEFDVARGSSPREFLLHLTTQSHPVTHYLILRAVQELEVSHFSIRVAPAVASLLTVTLILFLLPRVGVDRRVALMAGLLATFSVAALELAQSNRSYSLDALAAALIIAGLLLYLQTGRKTLFCVTLFLSPSVDYGSAIFGIAALATATIIPPPPPHPDSQSWNPASENRLSWLARAECWLKERKALVWPAMCWLSGVATTWSLTLNQQFQQAQSGGGGGRYYFDWNAPLYETLPFSLSRLWELLTWLMPSVVAALAIGAFGILLVNSLVQRRFHPILLLTMLALVVSVVLALLRYYPLGDTRQVLYLGPLLFIAVGFAFCGVADRLAAWTRREWLAPAVLTGLAMLSGLAGTAAIRSAEVYGTRADPVADFYAALKERVQADDAVYAATPAFQQSLFYLWRKPAYHRNWVCASPSVAGCIQETVNLTLRDQPGAQRLWFIAQGEPGPKEQALQNWERAGLVEHIPIGQGSDQGRRVWLMRDTGWLREKQAALAAERRDITAGAPAARSRFDLYLRDETLYYHKKPCNTPKIVKLLVADYHGEFFLNLVPFAVADLPPARRSSGRQGLSFIFLRRGALLGDSCFAKIPLPDYDFPLAEIRAGQYVDEGGPLWEVIIDRRPAYFRSVYLEVTATAPVAQGVFDLYLKDDALYYYKEQCAPADTAARFRLHLVPVDVWDLPPEQRRNGVGNRDFDFARYGAVFDGKCMARIRRPDYPVAAIRAGQFTEEAGNIWTVELPLPSGAAYAEKYAAITAGEPDLPGKFNLYLRDNTLAYVKEQCSPEDANMRFFLHIVPVNLTDLPGGRWLYGIDNLDFALEQRGARFDGKCLVTVGLPDYPIAAIRTGQLLPGAPPAWSVELAVGQ